MSRVVRGRLSAAIVATLVFVVALAAGAAVPTCARATPAGSHAAGGSEFALLIKPSGSLWATGYNNHGQLGVGDLVARVVLTRVGVGTDWATVAAGTDHSLALRTDGSLWAWGDNADGELGLGDVAQRTSPTQVGTDMDWAAIAAGRYFSLALKTDGSLWAWGRNLYGQLGLGDTTQRLTPSRVGSGRDWASVSCGIQHALALKTDGSLWAWGRNQRYQLGLGTTMQQVSPTRVGSGTDWAFVSCGDEDNAALKTDASLWSWGYNSYGQLGLGDTASRSEPTRVGAASDWADVERGDDHAVATKADGSLWAWGDNNYGQLGQGYQGLATYLSTPTRVGIQTGWTTLVSGDDFSTAERPDGSRWVWGDNVYGQLGLGDSADRTIETLHLFLGDVTAPTIASLGSPSHPDSASWYSDATPTFDWTPAGDASGIAGFTWVLDSSPTGSAIVKTPVTTTTVTYANGRADGVWYFHVRAVDRAGNWGASSTRQIRIDTTAPSVTLTRPADGASYVQGSDVTCEWTSGDALAGVVSEMATVDGSLIANGARLDTLATGPHSFALAVTDSAGNVTTRAAEFNVTTPPPTPTVSAPTGTGSYTPGSPLTVSWTTNVTVATGEFGVWAVNSVGGWFVGDTVPASEASASYSHNLPLDVPVDSGYTILVMYRATVGTGAWTTFGYSPGTFAVTAAPPVLSLTVSAPTGTGSYTPGSPLTVSWTTNVTVATGEFGVWAVNSVGGWFVGDTVPASEASASYSHNLPLDVPVDSGYTILVMYRATVGTGAWTTFGYSPGTFAVTAAPPVLSLTVSAPTGTGSYTPGSPLTVSWTTNVTVATGEFGVWAVNSVGGWFVGDTVPASEASASYSHNLPLDVPVDSGYTILVMYRATVGTGAWTTFGYGCGTLDVN